MGAQRARRPTEGEASPAKDSRIDETGPGVPRGAHAPERAPRETPSIGGVEANALTDRELLLQREIKDDVLNW